MKRLLELPVVQYGIVLANLSFFVLMFLVAQQLRNPNGPDGEMYPTAPPNEVNRVALSNGISIVAPENWDQVEAEYSELKIAARGRPAARFKSVVTVRKQTEVPGSRILDRCNRLEFQGLPAFEICRVLRRDSFDDPAMSKYDLYFEREGNWWHVNFFVADEMTHLPGSIRQYIDTVRVK